MNLHPLLAGLVIALALAVSAFACWRAVKQGKVGPQYGLKWTDKGGGKRG